MRNWMAVDQEESLLDEVAHRRQRFSARVATMHQSTAVNLGAYADAYSWMDPTAMQSLVQAGLAPDSPQAIAIADIAAQQASEDGDFDDPSDNLPDPWYETLANVATGWAKPIVRTGFTILATPIEELDALLSSAGQAFLEGTPSADEYFDAEGNRDFSKITGIEDAPIFDVLSNLPERLGNFWTNYTTKAARSGGLLALGDLLQGKAPDLGQGFLPGGEIFEEREAAKHRLQLDGQFVTAGRLVGRSLAEPGSTAYQMVSGIYDTGKQIYGDPAAGGLKALSQAGEATRTFQATGLVSGLRKTVAPEMAVNHYLTSTLGRRMVTWLTDTRDVDDIWSAIGRVDVGIADRLARSTTEAETFQVLSEVLGTTVRTRPTASFLSRAPGMVGQRVTGNTNYGALFGGGAAVRRSLRNSRLAGEMPGQVLAVDDINHAAVQLDSWMRNAKLSPELRKARIAELATVGDGDGIGLYAVAEKIMSDTEGVLVRDWGVKASRAKKLTQMYASLSDDVHTFGMDSLGRHEDVLAPLRPTIDGQVVDVPRGLPLLQSEMANGIIPLPPSALEIRRLTPAVRQLQGLYDSGLWKGSVDGIDHLMSSIWKPFQLLRGAYTVRVIAEEQMRMAGAGYDSLIRHPMSAIAWSLSLDPSSKLGKKMAGLVGKVIDPKGTATVTGELWDDLAEHVSAMSRGSAGFAGHPGEVLTGRFVKARHGDDPDFYRGWTTELAHMTNDPVMRRLAGGLKDGELRAIGGGTGNTVADVKEWFWSASGGKKFRESWSRLEGRSALATDRRAADGYIDVFVNRLHNSTGGNTDLVEAIASGKLGDLNLRGFGHERKMAAVLEESYDSAAPRFVKKEEAIRVRGRNQTGFDRVVDMGFDTLMSKPTNWLSRSPTFRQKYWQRAEELIGSADASTQEAIILAARDANVGDDILTRMASQVLKGPGETVASLDDVDTLAKGFALSETKKLLYDLNKRSQFFDMTRLIFPFGEAWKEIIGAWTGILRQSPAVARRFQQGLNGVRQPSLLPGATPETDPGTGQGFFHPDPQTGEEVFTYPASWAGKLLGINHQGAGVDFVGRAAGLNIVAATVLPGFGPVVQYPASKLIPKTPKYDDLRDVILPFGPVQGDNIVEEVADLVLPAWVDKVLTAFEDPEKHRLFGNTVADVQRALVAGGGYDLASTEGQQKLYDDAVSKARVLYLIRGFAQSTVPTGPSFQWSTTDVEGNVVPVKILSDDLRALTEQYGGNRQEAFGEWVRRYGVDNILAVVGKSTSVVERPVTEKGDAWLRAHADLERDFEATIGFFAPEPAAGEFDYSAYLRSFETGARESVSPSEQLALANEFLGRIQWENAKKLGEFIPGPQTSLFLAQVKTQIAEAYPGFDGWVAQKVWQQRPSTEQLIGELRSAVENPTLANTDTGEGTLKYLSALNAAESMVSMLPGNVTRYQQAKAAMPVRAWLRSVARQIIEEHPDFARVWEMVFERELVDDEGGFS